MKKDETYQEYKAGSEELVAALVNEHAGWAEAIARSVARSWNLDWQLDGLDGGAYEALLFCARRFDPKMGVPFRAYARRRIHESSTEEARKSKSWQKGVGTNSPEEQAAREISAHLFHIFPELREGILPESQDEGEEGLRTTVRQMIASASLIASFHDSGMENPEKVVQYRQLVEVVALLEPVHQQIIWSMYWKGLSMRALADEWSIDELAIIREHQQILQHVFSAINAGRNKPVKKLKVRPGLRTVAQSLRRNKQPPPFGALAVASILMLSVAHYLTTCANYCQGGTW